MTTIAKTMVWHLHSLLVVIVVFFVIATKANASEVLVIEGDTIRGNEEQPMVTHIVPWADQFPEWPNAAIEAYAMEEALLNPIEPAQIRNEVDFIRAIIGHKKQRTSDE